MLVLVLLLIPGLRLLVE
jgi:hypothetical protein